MLRLLVQGTLVLATLAAAVALYLLVWPVPVSPVAWEAPDSPGYVGVFATNDVLARADSLTTLGESGPEAIIADASGRLYTGTSDGWIIRYDSGGVAPQRWVRTGGRPLGMAFDSTGTLWCADGALGLIAIAPDGSLRVVATEADGVPIGLADYVDVARDGRVYFSDATTKFGSSHGHALEASLLEILEHRGNGRLLEYDPSTDSIRVLLGGLVFANGVALTHDDSAVLVTETGSNRVLRVERLGPGRGAVTTLIDALPGFPDNITRGEDGRYWIALVSPRNALVDRLAPYPFLRKVVRRLPDAIRPAPVNYSHVVAVNDSGRVLASLQDPDGHFPMLTHALEHDGWLYLGSLSAPHAARLRWPDGR
ncbi:MAG: SMP-30/gluconolactonase/LRE family protein [Gemmatimonadaceae bacterium]|nr:SMP-30/gluconolactonase/LRE family protein [Gemmatimonadaceae bacterium]